MSAIHQNRRRKDTRVASAWRACRALAGLALAAVLLAPARSPGSVAASATNAASPLTSSRLPDSPAAAPMILAGGTDPNAYGYRLATRIIGEALQGMGVAVAFHGYPMARRILALKAGKVDGDLGRTADFGLTHPDLVRVDMPWSEQHFVLYTANPTLHLKNLEALQNQDVVVEHRRGIVVCADMLREAKVRNLGDVTAERQGLHKLLAGRVDYYCDLEWSVRDALRSDEFKNAANLRKVLDLGSKPIYVYLHKRHATFAPKLAAKLKQMKESGRIERIRRQLDKELGLAH